MARSFKLVIEAYPPSEQRPQTCIKAVEQVRTASPVEVLHFALAPSPTEADLDWLGEVITAELRSLTYRTSGTQTLLEF